MSITPIARSRRRGPRMICGGATACGSRPCRSRELRQIEPALAPGFKHAVWFPDCIRTTNPHLLTRALAERFVQDGGEFRQETVRDIAFDPDGVLTLETDMGAAADRAAGGRDRRLFQAMGGQARQLRAARHRARLSPDGCPIPASSSGGP
ncbi:MAG: FAD-dependent oxidoreductase [Pseudomonadota bacterium]